MKRAVVAVLATSVIGLVAPVALADTIVLQEALFNVNGTQYHNKLAVPGLNSGGFDASTGEGTLVETFNPGAAGTYNFDAYFDHELSVPFFNEYGMVNGSPSAGQTWQIDDPTFGAIFGNTGSDTLDDTNWVPGTTDNFAGGCNSVYDPGCANSNDDVSMAMGFDFTLTGNEQAVITLTLSQTPPASGFYLAQVHPADANNDVQTTLYFTGSIVIESSTPPPVPEPGTLALFGTAGAIILAVFRRKTARG